MRSFIGTMRSNTSAISGISFYPGDPGVFGCAWCVGKASLWDTHAREEVCEFKFALRANGVDMSVSGELAVALGSGARICDPITGTAVLSLGVNSCASVAWCPGSSQVLAGGL